LEWPYLTCVKFWFYKNVFRKMEFVPDGVIGGYCRGTEKGSEYSKGTAKEMGMVMCD
jgi:hypothetical protein